jgi:hypothetical protein
VIETLVTNVQRAMQAEEVKRPDGMGTGEYRYEGSVANRALELLGKHLGMFIDRHELAGKDGGPIQTEEVKARDEVARRIAGLAARNGAAGDHSKPN